MARDLSEDAVQVQSGGIGVLHHQQQGHHREHEDDYRENDDDYSDDDDVDGEMLYSNFLSQRLAEEQIQFPQYQYEQFHYRNYVNDGNGRDSLTSDRFDRYGFNGTPRNHHRDDLSRDINTLTETFRRSGGRQEVFRRAAIIDLDTLTMENMTTMLSELFHDGGITQERILVLFYFCSDLAIRAVKAGLTRLVSNMTRWSLAFIRGTVSAWVRCRGGWRDLLRVDTNNDRDSRMYQNTMDVINQVAFISACAAVLGVCAVYIRKNL